METITAYVLAGGKSRRMGFNKLHVRIDGRTLLERTLDICEKCFERVKLVAGSEADLSQFQHEVILDSPSAQGPMAGIIAALEDCQGDSCFVTATDFPDLTPDLIESLRTQYAGQQYFGLIEANGLQPLCGIYHKSSLKDFYHRAKMKKYCLAGVLDLLTHGGIEITLDRWRNINTPEDVTSGERNG